MKFRQLPYTEKTIKVRKMTMGVLVQTIAQALIRNQKQNMEVRIVDCYMGEVDKYDGIEGLLMQDFQMDWEVNVYSITSMHNNVEDYDYLNVVISDDVEMMD